MPKTLADINRENRKKWSQDSEASPFADPKEVKKVQGKIKKLRERRDYLLRSDDWRNHKDELDKIDNDLEDLNHVLRQL